MGIKCPYYNQNIKFVFEPLQQIGHYQSNEQDGPHEISLASKQIWLI